MKPVLAILLLFSFMYAYTGFGEILKLPILVQHYLDHTNDDKDLTLYQFLMQHYSDSMRNDHQQHHDHKNLPFKTTDSHFSSAVSLMVPGSVVVVHDSPCLDMELPFSRQLFYKNISINNVWQPPRV